MTSGEDYFERTHFLRVAKAATDRRRAVAERMRDPVALAAPEPLRRWGERLRRELARPVDALPVDLFRILVGALSFAYFARCLLETDYFSAPDGLIDHLLVREMFWFTRMSLFYPGLGAGFFKAVFALGCVGSLAVMAGWRVKLVGFFLYALAVSTYRWNFLVTYVDDSIMHLALFWLLLLPVGRTLVLGEYLAEGRAAWSRWMAARVSGTEVRCFIWNFALIYCVAGLWKLTSPLWRNGTALAVVLRLPISFSPELGRPEHLPLLILLNYLSIAVEILVPLMLVLPVGHWARYVLLVGMFGLHLGILAALDIPFANIACIAANVLVFREELMQWLRRFASLRLAAPRPSRIGARGALAFGFVATLTLAMASSITLPEWRAPFRRPETGLAKASHVVNSRPAPDRIDGLGRFQLVFFSALWAVGIAQQYQLFNWIDQRNYQIRYFVREKGPDGTERTLEPATFFPRSTRHVLLHCYLHGVTWMEVPRGRHEALRLSIAERLAANYCRRWQPRGEIAVDAQVWRIDPWQPDPNETPRAPFLRFRCTGDEPRIAYLPGSR